VAAAVALVEALVVSPAKQKRWSGTVLCNGRRGEEYGDDFAILGQGDLVHDRLLLRYRVTTRNTSIKMTSTNEN